MPNTAFPTDSGEVSSSKTVPSLVDTFFQEAPQLMGVVEVVGEDIRHLTDNAAAARFLGLPPGATANRLATEMGVPAEVLALWLDRYRESQRTGRTVQFEYHHPTPTGTRCLLARVSPISGPKDAPPCFRYIVDDVTEVRQFEQEALRVSEEKFSKAFAGNPAAMILSRLDDGRFAEVNETWVSLMGYGREEAVGHTSRELGIWLDAASRERFVTELRRTGTIRDWEERFRRKTGEEIVALLSAEVLTIGGETMALSTMLDITERKRVEGELREATDRFRSVLEQSQDVAYRRDLAHDRYDYISPVCEQVLGFSAEQMGRKTVEELLARIHPEDRGAVETGFAQAMETGAGQLVYRWLHTDGQWRWLADHMIVVNDEAGVPLYLSGVARDITERRAADLRLQENEEKLRIAMEAGHLGMWVYTFEGNRWELDPRARRMYGISQAEMVHDDPHLKELLPEEDLSNMWEAVRRACDPAGGGHYEAEYRVRRPEGGWRWISAWGQVEFEGEGANRRPVRMIGASRDVTETKEAEESQRVSEEKFARAFASNPAAISLTRLKDGLVLDVNQTWVEMMGHRREDAIGKTAQGLKLWADPDDRERYIEELHRTGSLRNREQRFRRRSGEAFVALVSVEVLTVGSEQMTLLTFLDITERKRAEVALRESEERFRTLADNMSQLAWMADADGTLFWFNKRWYDYTGMAPGEVVNLDRERMHHPDHSARVGEHWRRSLEGGEPWEDTFPLRGKDGEFRWFLSRALPVRDDAGRIVRWFGTNTDITEQRRLEETLRRQTEALAAADRAKDDFLAMLAHELRNPIGAIGNATALLGISAAGQDALRKPLEILDRQVRHTARLVDDLLDVSRISRGKLELRRETVDLVGIAQRAAEAVQPEMVVFNHSFHVSLPMQPLWMNGDPARLEQVLGNLLNNAAKYTEPGGAVELTLQRAGEEAVIQVRDTGEGIAPEMLPRIFDLFAQEDRSLARSRGGLGIGLTLVKTLVEMHGGHVQAESAGHGFGSSFTVRLPLMRPETTGERPEEATSGSEALVRDLRVLVVDDNVDAAQVLAEILGMWGHETHLAHDGGTAIEAARSYRPDVVLLDIGLPGMDGYEVARHLRDIEGFAPEQLVAVTGYGQAADRRRSEAAGFGRHLVKPVEMTTLQSLMANLAAQFSL